MSSITPVYFLQAFHGAQAALAGYGAYNSFIAIRNLKEYEETTRKAAKWSNEVQRQLDMTTNTQGAAAFSIVLSIAASVALAAAPSYLPSLARTLISPALLVGLIAARQYIKSFWGPQGGTRVPLPGMNDYNEAQQKTKAILDVLEYLEYSWVATSVAWLLISS